MARLAWLAAANPDDEGLRLQAEEARRQAEAEVEELLDLGIWHGLEDKKDRLKKILLHDTRVREFRKGEVIVREGDYGNSAFVVLRGSCRVVLPGGEGLSAAQVGKTPRKKVGVLRSFIERIACRGEEVRDPATLRRTAGGQEDYVPIFLQDVPRVISRNRTVVLGEGELFGEISVLGRTPRTATIFADADDLPPPEDDPARGPRPGTALLEIRWQGLRDLLKADTGFKEHVYRLYRRNSLHQHLQATPMLRFVGRGPELRALVAERRSNVLFTERLGWEAFSTTLLVGPRDTAPLTFQLRVANGPQAGRVLPLDPSATTIIGRGHDANLQIPTDQSLSRSHATVRYDGDHWLLTNTSRFGTRIGRQVVRRDHILAVNDAITLGNTTVVFELTPDARARMAEGSSAGAFRLSGIARTPAAHPLAGLAVYSCSAPALPDPQTRAALQEQITRNHSARNIVLFLAEGTRQQAWRWLLPLPDDPGSHQPREVVFADTKPPTSLLEGLVRPLFMAELARHTEFQSYGEFTWSKRTQEEREQGVDWSRRAQQEPSISAEGSYPNGVILVRSGFARLSQRYDQGTRTISYLGRGEAYGFEEIAHNWRHPERPVQYQRSLTALGYCDVLFIPTAVVESLVLPSFPAAALPPPIAPRSTSLALARPPRSQGLDEALIEFLVERRFVNGTRAMVIDLERCTRCDDCVRACASNHQGNPRFIRHGPSDGRYMLANACMHCSDPVCMIGCPTGAIHRSLEGEVVVNDATCIGCSTCANNCPYDNIRMVEVRDPRGNLVLDERNEPIRRSTKCDLCFDRLGGPACARACPHDALVRIDLNTPGPLARWIR